MIRFQGKRRLVGWKSIATIASLLLLTAEAQPQEIKVVEPPVPRTMPVLPGLGASSQRSTGHSADLAHSRLLRLGIPMYFSVWSSGHAELRNLAGEWRVDQHAFYENTNATLVDFFETRASYLAKGDVVIGGQSSEYPYRVLPLEDQQYLAEVDAKIAEVLTHRAEVRPALRSFDEVIRNHVLNLPSAESSMDRANDLPLPGELRALLSKRFSSSPPSETPKDGPLTAKILAVEVTDKLYAENLSQAEINLGRASTDYDNAREDEEATRTRFQKTLVQHSQNTENLFDRRNKILAKLVKLQQAKFKPISPMAKLKNSVHYQNLLVELARANATMKRLEGRKEQVREFGGSEKSVRPALLALQVAIDKVAVRAENLNTDLATLVATVQKPEVAAPNYSPEAEGLKRSLEAIARQIKKENDALEVASETLSRDFDKLNETDQTLAEAMQRLNDLRGKGAKPLLNIQTNGIFEAKFTNRRAELEDLNLAIKHNRQAVFEARYQRERFRFSMMEANEETSVASEKLQTAIMASASGQLAIEAFLQVKSGLDAAKGGPGVFILWAANQTAQNIFNPPKIYEPEYRLDGAQSTIVQIANGFIVKDKQEALDRAAKYGRGKPFDHLKSITSDTLKLGHIEKEMREILAQTASNSSGDYLNTKSLAQLRTRFKSQRAIYGSASEAISINTLGRGKLKFAAKLSGGALDSLVKSLATEAIKREIADFFEGEAWRNYMRANNRFVAAVRTFRTAGNIYWRNMDTLAGLRALRQKIKLKYYDEESGLLITQSDPFEVKEEMRFWLNFSDKDGEPSTKPHPGDVKVFLNSVELHRYPNSNIFDMLRTDAEKLRKIGQKKLTMKIVFE